MKSLLRSFLINSVAIFLASTLLAGLSFGGNLKILAQAGAVLTLVNLLVKPVIKLLTLPLNLLTLGIFSWAVDILMLFFVTLLVPGFKIAAFSFPGLVIAGFITPSFYVSLFFSFLAVSILISFIVSFLFWLFR